METNDILKLAESQGLQLKGEMGFNEMGIDFRVGFAVDIHGKEWVLRIPRRDDLAEQIDKERKILRLAGKHLSIAVPNWKIAGPALVAYPLLENKPVITFDPETYEVTWNIDQDCSRFVPSLASVLVQLHRIPVQEAESIGIKSLTPDQLRQEVATNMETVRRELGISAALETRWRAWLDNDGLWPGFTTFIHGDLYAGHILATNNGEITGIIDWSEGQVNDPAIDFSGHISVFGEESLKELIRCYGKLGGKVWDNLFQQAVERHAAAPLNYGIFAINNSSDKHIEAARAQLGVG